MAARRPRALLALGLGLALAAAAAAAADPFAPQLGDTAACHAQCGRRLPHRAAADAVLNACYRGCRLFSICHFVDASAELNATRAECEAACAEAYGGAEEQSGCATGCREQLPQSRELKPPPSFSVFDLVSTFCTDIVSSAQSFISSTWTFYLQADDGKVVVFQSQPELEDAVPEAPAARMERTWPGPGPRAGPREPGQEPPAQEPAGGKAPVGRAEPPPPEHDFLGCISKRSGLPRWILAACLFLSVVVMLWLSCASLVTAPEQHVKSQDGPSRGRGGSWDAAELRQEVGKAGSAPAWARHLCPRLGPSQPAAARPRLPGAAAPEVGPGVRTGSRGRSPLRRRSPSLHSAPRRGV
ncbi:transmembrane protein 59-like isoform X2 [Struthio camelus]|uniref:transmembrane protein 59-like isoform X2 n=1 Tax=Struthio camelus TaxID=8801 RepID=UPI0036042A06